MNMINSVNFTVREHNDMPELCVIEMHKDGVELDSVVAPPAFVGSEMQNMYKAFQKQRKAQMRAAQ